MVSDNSATNLLIRHPGIEDIDTLARDLGLRYILLAREMMDCGARARGVESFTSASDMARHLRSAVPVAKLAVASIPEAYSTYPGALA